MAAMQVQEGDSSAPEADRDRLTLSGVVKAVAFLAALLVVTLGTSPVRIAALLLLGADFLLAALLARRFPRMLRWVGFESRGQAFIWGSASALMGLAFLALHASS
jgi:hypothetical protein